MAPKQGLTALEVLGMAIKSESEVTSLYARMAGLARNTLPVIRLNFLCQIIQKLG